MTRRVTVVSLLTAMIAALFVPTASAAPTYRNYVSLGDSFVSGPFIPIQRLDPLSCFKSTQNYPSVLARRLGIANFTDISCGGALITSRTSIGMLRGTPPRPGAADARAAIAYACPGLSTSTIQ